MSTTQKSGANDPVAIDTSPWLDVFIETPKGSFLKRGWTGDIDFVSPFPCPFNYGSVDGYLGLEGDMLDAVVLGPRLRRGSRVRVRAFGAVGLTDHGMYDDKLICSRQAVSPVQRRMVLMFFRLYAKGKGILNIWRRRSGPNRCEGWKDVRGAMARARLLGEGVGSK